MLLAVEEVAEHGAEAAGWFLENAWLIPIIPAVAFFGIIFFGKKLPRGGSELGLLSMVASFVIAAGATFQWIDRVSSSHGEEVAPVVKQVVWWQSGGIEFGIGQQIDGLAVMALVLVTFISTLVQIFSTRVRPRAIAATHTSSRPSPSSPPACSRWCSHRTWCS